MTCGSDCDHFAVRFPIEECGGIFYCHLLKQDITNETLIDGSPLCCPLRAEKITK